MEELSILRSIDTNIVVRLLLRDDPAQVALVDALVAEGGLIVSPTVLIETEWVLRAVYRLDRPTVSRLLTLLVDIEGVDVPDPPGVRWALGRHAAGADLADMIHLIVTESDAFVTLDQRLASDAGSSPRQPVTVLR